MLNYPKIRLLLSNTGVDEIEVLYLPGQRREAWELCQELLPRLQALETTINRQPEA